MADLTVLGLGAGWQSTTLALLAGRGLVEPMPDFAVFADTKAEPRQVYKNVEWLRGELPYPVRIVDCGRSLRDDLLAGVNHTGHRYVEIPLRVRNPDGSRGLTRRQCTSNYKIKPINDEIRRELGYGPGEKVKRGIQVEHWFGISTDEVGRTRDSKSHWIINRYPLIELDWSREDCGEWFREHYPDRQLPRSACTFCPFRSSEEWVALRESEPAAFEDAVEIDYMLRDRNTEASKALLKGTPYIHRTYQPLDVAIETYEQDKAMQPELWDWENECEGVCGV